MGTDVASIMAGPIGQPLATVIGFCYLNCGIDAQYCCVQIFFNSFGQKGTLALWSFIVIAQ
jgi:hypothetical protein